MEAEIPFHEVVRGSTKAMFECAHGKIRRPITSLSHQGKITFIMYLNKTPETSQVRIL